MSGDINTYRRASGHCVLGLILQIIVGCGLLIYGAVGQEPTAITGSIFALAGVLPWLVLLILYDQHRRERIEAMEAEAFAATDAATSSVFEEVGDDLRVSGRRLRLLRLYAVPAVGLVFAAILATLGVLRFGPGREAAQPATFVEPTHDLVGLTLGLAIAVLGFMFSRYTAGMAKRPAWTALQGGATVAAGTALFGFVVALGHIVNQLGSDQVLRAMLYIAPALLVVLGAETVLNFLLELYRPRKPDEGFRPPFASRLLGPLASPETVAESVSGAIDYQFGYEVSRSWMYQLLTRRAWLLVLVALLLIWGMTSVVVVRPDQTAIHTRFGGVVRASVEPGLRWKWPWPIDRIEVPGVYEPLEDGGTRLTGRSTAVVRMVWGASAPRALDDRPPLWSNLQEEDDSSMLVQPSRDTVSGVGGATDGRDLSLMRVEVPVRFAIDDVEAWALLTQDGAHQEILDRITQRVVMRYLVRTRVDELLGAQRREMAAEIRDRLHDEYVRINPKSDGEPVVRILSVGVTGVAPPAGASLQFEQVIEAQQKYLAQKAAAEADAIQTLTEVVGSVDLADSIVASIEELNALTELQSQEATDERSRRIVEKQIEIEALLADAGGEAAALIAEANAGRWERHMGERGDAALYAGQLAADRANSSYYRAQLYLQRFFDALQDRRVTIVPDAADLQLDVDVTFERQDTGFLQDDFRGGG
ncbi:MAG: SPFH domain-containing protein [Planctomycetota bacterium]